MMYVYILKCSDNSYYIGVTNNIERRLDEHNNGLNIDSYTFKRRPVELVFIENFQTGIDAINFEKKIKKWTRIKKEALINRKWEELKSLSECKNITSHKLFQK